MDVRRTAGGRSRPTPVLPRVTAGRRSANWPCDSAPDLARATLARALLPVRLEVLSLVPRSHFDPLWGQVDPEAGKWFPAQELELARNANPALP